VRVLGISGSPRAGGNTDRIVQEALNAAKEEGAETELLRHAMPVKAASRPRSAPSRMMVKSYTGRLPKPME